MIRGIYTAVSGLISQEAKQDVISSNLANANTVGYKKDNLITKKFDDVLIQNYDKVVNGENVRTVIGSLSLGSKLDETYVNFDQGVIESTGKETDFALQGRGFFVVQRDNGINTENYYTRDGHFHVNSYGFLVNNSGDRVLGRNINTGNIEPINVVRDGRTSIISSDEKGNISLNDTPSYELYMADFDNYYTLKKMEDNLYTAENPRVLEGSKVQQNALERSNVDIMAEMAEMMVTMRSFESNQKVVQSLDETLGKAVNEVGRI